jgi:uncharacterized protein (TIGR03435 family)
MSHSGWAVFGAALGLLAAGPIGAQEDLVFDVASVRAAAPQAPLSGAEVLPMRLAGGPGTSDPERLRYAGVSMLRLLAQTFQMQADQIVGPEWVKSQFGPERFDINANVRPGATREQMNVMMRNLLRDRFRLQYHIDKKDFEGFELVVAKSGSKLMDAEVPSEAPVAPSGRLQVTRGQDGYPVLPAGSTMGEGASSNGQIFMSLDAFKGFVLAPAPGGRRPAMGLTKFTLRMVTVGQLIAAMQLYMDTSHVVDRTGLTGKYDVKVEFAAGIAPGADASDPAPDVFAAFEKQLGLKFQKVKMPLDVIVIDHIEKEPTEN